MTEETVLYAADGKVGIVTLNRPAKTQRADHGDAARDRAELLRADADEATSVIVLRGGRAQFCVGFDVGGGAATSGHGGMTR